ncbi:hypothetical protein L332_11670 [Agrococcus pavilionensis RW1]|uniref:Uncharacterized protein n=1 Tax=Agrococcus pavilionensis RW1 TaxID=1330458 RepID=U1LRH4_9MICO|nr:hypothetical protein L332_11670 [Agrococcus pavilionensis RW1]
MLLVTPDFPPGVGGVQSVMHRIAAAMPNADVTVLTPDAPGAAAFDRTASVRVRRVRVPAGPPKLRSAAFNARGLFAIRGLRPDVVLSGHIASSPLGIAAARLHRVPFVVYAHGKEVLGHPALAAWALRSSAGAVAVSRFTRGLLLETVGGRPHPPVHVIHPGVEIPPGPAPERLERAGRPFTMVTVGRLRDRYKGHDVVLEALPRVLERLPDARWIVIGDGRQRAELEARAARLGVAHAVSFLGAVPDAEKDAKLREADVFVMPARYPAGEVAVEGFAIVYLEAAAWGVPAIAGDVGGPREAVVDGETSLLVDPESPERIAEAILSLAEDPARRRRLGDRARRRAAAEFTWEHVAGQLERLLRLVAQR